MERQSEGTEASEIGQKGYTAMSANQAKEQPLPASFVDGNEFHCTGEAEVKEDTPMYKRRGFAFGCSILAGLALLFGFVVLVLALTVFRRRQPVISVTNVVLQDLDLSKLNLSDIAASSIALTIGVDVSVYNPNHASFRYGNGTSHMYYRGAEVGHAPIPEGRIGAHASENLSTSIQLSADTGVLMSPYVFSDLDSGFFPISTTAEVSGRLNFFNIFKHHARSSSFCVVTISVKKRSVYNISCSSHVKL